MKKVLFATTALVMTAGFAAAEVSVGGDARMGVIGGGSDILDEADGGIGPNGIDETDLGFTSRIRISFSASGETDAGLAFGGTVRADNYERDQATNGFEGSVFVEGSFGKISMGDVAGAPEAAVGDLSGVGLTGLGDTNENLYLSNTANITRPAARWDYVTGDFGVHVSADNPAGLSEAYGIAVTYSMGDFSFGLGYEDSDEVGATGLDGDHWIGGLTAGFGDATFKAIYGSADLSGFGIDQYGFSLDYVTGATTLTAFYRSVDTDDGDADAYGVGVSYDLGGGAALKAGIVDGDDIGPLNNQELGGLNLNFGQEFDDPTYDFGISMSF